MSTSHLIIDTAERILSRHCSKSLLEQVEAGEFPDALWATLRESDLHQLASPDSGIELSECFAVIRCAARYGAPLPLGEAFLATRWSGFDGFATIGLIEGERVVDAPWARCAECVLALDPVGNRYLMVSEIDLQASGISLGRNVAGEPRDTFAVPSGQTWHLLEEPAMDMLALTRTVSMAGALERVLDLCLQYASEREQFGRPIGQFQAIQQQLALAASEVAAAGCAAEAAVCAIGYDRFVPELAAAKARVGEAAGTVVEIAHQVFGAMGYTYEHELHHFTRRLWAWRDEFGSEVSWQHRLGRYIASLGADGLWPFLAADS